MNDTILSIKNIKKKYFTKSGEITAIDNISLDINEGEFIAIVGPSGCGKSTLLSILSGLIDKSSGEIIYPNQKKKKLGYMLQQDCLFPWLNILDNCLIGLKIEKNLTKEKKERVIKLLELYGLKDFIYKYPKSLSGGMRQRVLRILYTHK